MDGGQSRDTEFEDGKYVFRRADSVCGEKVQGDVIIQIVGSNDASFARV